MNEAKLRKAIEGYKAYLPEHWKDEQYKWEAVQCFQDNWDTEAEDFGEMFERATAKAKRFLSVSHNNIRWRISELAKTNEARIRAFFNLLYDESIPLEERFASARRFVTECDQKFTDEDWNKALSQTWTVSTLLWLRFPEKYYVYRYETYVDVSQLFEASYRPVFQGDEKTAIEGFSFYDELCAKLRDDAELCQMLQQLLNDGCYRDAEKHVVTVAFGMYIHDHYKELIQMKEQYWWMSPNTSEWNCAELGMNEVKSYSLLTESGNPRKGQEKFSQMQPGDPIVFYEVAPTQAMIAVGEVVQGSNGECILVKKTKNAKQPVKLKQLEAISELKAMEFFSTQQSICRLTEKEYETILSMIDCGAAPESYTKDDFLREVYMSSERYDRLAALLRNKKNLILQGAPGVGKTFIAKRLAYSLMGEKNDERVALVQFHQSYSYEDFVLGYRPDGEGFRLTEGIFYRFCKKAEADPEHDYYFIIDEINRGNLSKIFGELLMLIERDYRGTEAVLAYSGEGFSVPENLYLIGMMNTADRSLALIDYALRRRFSFFEIDPALDEPGFLGYVKQCSSPGLERLLSEVGSLNREIAGDATLGRGFRIGHSYFCGRTAETCTSQWLESVVDFDLIPMLEEYWFDEPDKLRDWKKRLLGAVHDEG